MKDKLSALLDGALDEHSVHSVLDAARRDPTLRAEWNAYCLIGDVIRGEQATAPDFLDRVMQRIEAEPTRVAPASAAASAARRGLWRTVMPVAASVMGVAAVGLVARTLYSDPVEPAPLAAVVTRSQPAVAVAPVVARAESNRGAAATDADPYHDYVFAHQAMTVGGPIPDAIQYVRTVSSVRQDSGR